MCFKVVQLMKAIQLYCGQFSLWVTQPSLEALEASALLRVSKLV